MESSGGGGGGSPIVTGGTVQNRAPNWSGERSFKIRHYSLHNFLSTPRTATGHRYHPPARGGEHVRRRGLSPWGPQAGTSRPGRLPSSLRPPASRGPSRRPWAAPTPPSGSRRTKPGEIGVTDTSCLTPALLPVCCVNFSNPEVPPAGTCSTRWPRKRRLMAGLNWLVKFSSPRLNFPCRPSPKV